MSLYLPQGSTPISNEQAVAAGSVITAEGQALVRSSANPSAGVLPSTGASTDIFVGFAVAGSVGAPLAEPYYNAVETFVVPSSGQLTLANTPVTGQAALFDQTTNAAIAFGSGITLTGNVVAGLTAQAGDTVKVTYKYALTVAQSVMLFGNVQPGGFVGALIDQVGVVQVGNPFFTSEFDASVNWAGATAIKLAANGQLTNQTGSGVTIPGAVVVSVPTAGVPFLGINFGVPL